MKECGIWVPMIPTPNKWMHMPAPITIYGDSEYFKIADMQHAVKHAPPWLKGTYINIFKATCDPDSGPVDGAVPVPDTNRARGYRSSSNLQPLHYADLHSTGFYYVAEPTDSPATYLYKVYCAASNEISYLHLN